jgi:S-adenosyl-L-methionine hydrolase (adenosine-forming)
LQRNKHLLSQLENISYFCPMPIITLTTDFGIQNHALASVKGRILTALSDTQIIDISHTISGFNLQQAVYIFKQSYRHFPEGSFHFVLNDLYAHPAKQLLYAFENGQHIFCADNGFMTMLFDDKPMQLYKITDRIVNYNFLNIADLYISTTASILHNIHVGLENIAVNQIVVKQQAKAFYSNNMLEAQVIYIDQFGNVVLNVTHKQFEEARQGRNFKILFMRDEEITTMSEHYNDVQEGEKLCMFNTADHLEIAINRGNAARLFGFQESNDRSLFYNTIKLFFE